MKHPTPRVRWMNVTYQLVRPIAQGAVGAVYLAHHSDGYEVALKQLHEGYANQPDVIDRFFNEARVSQAVGHPGLVEYFESGFDTCGRPFLAMEFLRGVNLEERLGHGPIGLTEAIKIARQIAQTLAAAHAAGIVHRDLKPDNVFLVDDPVGPRVKVLDFGVAKFIDDSRTRIGKIFGTPLYMSPEQCRGATNASAQSDVYSLGCLLYQMVTGQTPFSGSLHEVLFAQLGKEAVPPVQLAPSMPAALDELIVAMLAKDPAARPQTMTAVDEALRLIAEPPRATRPRRVRRWALAAAIVVLLGCAGATVGLATHPARSGGQTPVEGR